MRLSTRFINVTAILSAVFALAGCRGDVSEKPPVHIVQNMDFMTYYEPQEENGFFADKRAMRPLVAGTVARGTLKDDPLHTYKNGDNYVTQLPMPLTKELLLKGQERYGIYCAVCHGKAGRGDGPVAKRGMVPPPNYLDQRVMEMPVGQFVEAITNGVRTMPAYGYAIDMKDRWAIAAYIRALQLSQSARLDQIPPDIASQKGWLSK